MQAKQETSVTLLMKIKNDVEDLKMQVANLDLKMTRLVLKEEKDKVAWKDRIKLFLIDSGMVLTTAFITSLLALFLYTNVFH